MSMDIEKKVNQLKELEAFIAEVEAEAETIKDEIKNYRIRKIILTTVELCLYNRDV